MAIRNNPGRFRRRAFAFSSSEPSRWSPLDSGKLFRPVRHEPAPPGPTSACILRSNTCLVVRWPPISPYKASTKNKPGPLVSWSYFALRHLRWWGCCGRWPAVGTAATFRAVARSRRKLTTKSPVASVSLPFGVGWLARPTPWLGLTPVFVSGGARGIGWHWSCWARAEAL